MIIKLFDQSSAKGNIGVFPQLFKIISSTLMSSLFIYPWKFMEIISGINFLEVELLAHRVFCIFNLERSCQIKL